MSPGRRDPRWRALLLLALLGALGAGCVEFEHLELCRIEGTTLSLNGATVSRGAVVAFRIIPVDDDGKVRKDRTVTVRSADRTILDLDHLSTQSSTCRGPDDERWYYAIWGVEIGDTTLHISVDGAEVEVVPVSVR